MDGTLNDVILSNVYGVTVSAPGAGNNGYYFREGQAVGVATGAATALRNTAHMGDRTGDLDV